MRILSRIKAFHLSHFSRPVADRVLYRAISRGQVRKVLEIGIGTADRAVRMIDLASRLSAGEPIAYVAVDLFEARPQETRGLALKEAHRLLKPTGAQVQLIPGDPLSALARTANSIGKVDLLLIAAEHDDAALAGAWFYVPRMLHETSRVFRATQPAGQAEALWQPVLAEEIDKLANVNRRRKAA